MRGWVSRWSKGRIATLFRGQRGLCRTETEITAFYLTDFLVRQFDAFVWKPMGLDRHPELRDMYFGNYTKLVYQAQIDDPPGHQGRGVRGPAGAGL